MAQESKVEKPVYQLIALDMAEKIISGRYEVGEKIHGRSTLASKYNVSPETVRRAMFLLKDMDILEMKQGSGIFIKNVEKAQSFVEKFRNLCAADELRANLGELMSQRDALEQKIRTSMMNLIDSYERFESANPLAPFELPIRKEDALTGRNLADVNFWHNTGATIIGIRRKGGLILSPGPYAEFCPGDIFLIVCDAESFARAKAYVRTGK
ncbi:MAG TPA: GntR family transcriptional regulator [Candidatus Pygmaiobacter gallistercoris]|nr:GntR family transcriptional regulator [Candidatus Pygmaiobacter gallistercoris]